MLVVLLLIPSQAQPPSRTLKIVIIDSGYDTINNRLKLCNEGIDLTNTDMYDIVGHGNNVSHLIADRLENYDYCIYPIKVFNSFNRGSNIEILINAMTIASNLNPDIINLSYGGNESYVDEHLIVKKLLDRNILLVAASGNENHNLDENCNFFPACYDNRIITVGNLKNNTEKAESSNYGKYVKKWNIGVNRFAGNVTLSGTSQATAIETANQALKLLKK